MDRVKTSDLRCRPWRVAMSLLATLGALLVAPSPRLIHAEAASPPLHVEVDVDRVQLSWQSDTAGQAGLEAQPLSAAPGITVQTSLLALAVPPAGIELSCAPERNSAGICITALESTPVRLTPLVTDALPQAPLYVLRESRIRAQRIAVLAVTPLYLSNGAARRVTRIQASVINATLVDAAASWDGTNALRPSRASAAATAPTNPAAFTPAWTVKVAQGGIQRVSGASLASSGFDITDTVPLSIHLRLNGVEVATQMIGLTGGHLTTASEVRFYAPPPGDRWNATQTYWLTVEATGGLRMNTRPAGAITATMSASAVDIGSWRNDTLYDSTLAGPDGDHWFSKDLRTAPGFSIAVWPVLLTPTLPLLAGSVVITLAGTAYVNTHHTFSVTLGSATSLAGFDGLGDGILTFNLAANAPSGQVALLPGSSNDAFHADSIAWQRPVLLDFGGKGARFHGAQGVWAYQLSNLPAGATLYDVTSLLVPQVLALNGNAQFQDGPDAHAYIVSGPGTLVTPTVQAHTPTDFNSLAGATALYIAPGDFQTALLPLLALRQSQGYLPHAVGVQAIYDAWSYGQVDPAAIRNFLRYGVTTWFPGLLSAVLVGHGSADPLDYSHYGANAVNLIPPYLLPVDPTIVETACDVCYGQLDGDDPLSDWLPDVMIGRFPVKTTAELNALVAKIIAYEIAQTGFPNMNWRTSMLFLADNYRDPVKDQYGNVLYWTTDGGGDFAQFSDNSAAQQPASVQIKRLYYDPYPPTYTGAPWRVPDALQAHAQALQLINAGAAVVTYQGHADQNQLAVTNPFSSTPYLISSADTGTLTNSDSTGLFLEMTCLTSAFQTPSSSGTTIDERLLLASGGAVAVWGSSGFGAAYGHNYLLQGFFTRLWASQPQQARLGDLVMNGYLTLFTQGGCCQDSLRTFILLGDPLTRLRVFAPERSFLPTIAR